MSSSFAVEQRSIDYVPPGERHGKARSLLFVWFAANTSITAVVTGALFILLGNNAVWSIVAIIIGNMAGGFFTSLHSAQGPRLGVPQMIQSRAQFGFLGAILPLVLALMIFVGFYATGLVLGGQALANLLHISQTVGASVFAVMSTILAIFGYRHIHRFSHFAAVLTGIVFVGLFIRLMMDGRTGEALHQGGFALAPFVLGVSLAASWQLTFGPYVADYSRYLPEDTPKVATVGWTFLGSAAGASLAMILGALVAAIGGAAFLHDQVGYLADLGGPLAWAVLLAVICGKLTGDTLSAYAGYMSMVTITTSLTRRSRIGQAQRILYVVLISGIALVIALAATATFLTTFTDFLLFLLYFMTPWSAVNLVDFYFVRKERYVTNDFFEPHGRYKLVNWGAIIAYVAGVLVQIPFMNSSLYVGPVARRMGGAEVAWLLGLAVAGLLYYLFSKQARDDARTIPLHPTPVSLAKEPS